MPPYFYSIILDEDLWIWTDPEGFTRLGRPLAKMWSNQLEEGKSAPGAIDAVTYRNITVLRKGTRWSIFGTRLTPPPLTNSPWPVSEDDSSTET